MQLTHQKFPTLDKEMIAHAPTWVLNTAGVFFGWRSMILSSRVSPQRTRNVRVGLFDFYKHYLICNNADYMVAKAKHHLHDVNYYLRSRVGTLRSM